MKILEFMHCLELDDIQTVRKDSIRFSLEEMLALVSSDMRDSGEDICTMGCAAFNAVSVIDTTFPCLVINVKVLKVVVKVDGTSAEVTAEEGGVGGEYGGDVNMPFPTKGDSNTGLPLMKVGDNSGG